MRMNRQLILFRTYPNTPNKNIVFEAGTYIYRVNNVFN